MSPDDTHPDAAAFAAHPPAGPTSGRCVEVWAGADHDADNLLVLQPDRGGYALTDPCNGWREVRHFAAYEAAYRWLTEEAYERADGR
jgi:hypothetical protein